MNNNIIAKIVGSIITVIVMGVIIVFVFNYYQDEAKNGNKKADKKEDQEIIVDNESFDSIPFNNYDSDRVELFLDNKRIILAVSLTDAGNVLVVNDEPVSYVNGSSVVKYVVNKDYLIIDIVTEDLESVYLINKDCNIVKTFESLYEYDRKYYISNPIHNDKVSSSVIVNDYIYITYVTDISDSSLSDVIYQFTIKAKYDGSYEIVLPYKNK